MKLIQSRFTQRCSATAKPDDPGSPCSFPVVDALTSTVDQSSAILMVVQDNLKILQTAQTALSTSYSALTKIQHDFDLRKRAVSSQRTPRPS